MGLRVTAATLEECVSFQPLSEAAFQSCTGARAEVIINLRCPLSQELFVEHLTASKWIGQGKNDGKGLSWRQQSVFQGEQSFVSLREPKRAVWQKHRVQCGLLIWGLSPVKGCWENKMEIQGCRCVTDVCVLWSTDKGTVQKVIVLPRDDLQTEELVLEEVEVFKVSFDCSLSLCHPPFYFCFAMCVCCA